MLKFLQGKKTYALAILAVVNILGFQAGFISEEVANTVFALLLPGMAVTLKAGQNRIESKKK
jgi:hypothetical protein